MLFSQTSGCHWALWQPCRERDHLALPWGCMLEGRAAGRWRGQWGCWRRGQSVLSLSPSQFWFTRERERDISDSTSWFWIPNSNIYNSDMPLWFQCILTFHTHDPAPLSLRHQPEIAHEVVNVGGRHASRAARRARETRSWRPPPEGQGGKLDPFLV